MSHIFVSYSHKDTGYAHALADNLQSMGFNVWIDGRLDYGSQWPHEIQAQLDSCDAFIVIMTPRAFASEWVQSELQRAKRKLKPIFPMLLEGDEPWLSVESTQFYDVRGEKLPDAKFYSAIRRVVSVSQNDTTLHYVKGKVKPAPSSGSVKPKISTEIIIALIGAVVTIVTACATIIGGPLIQKWLSSSSIPDPVVTVTATSESLLPFDPSVGVPSVIPDSTNVPMVLIPEGQFTMGSDADDALAECQKYSSDCDRSYYEDEEPPHTVSLSAFYIDKYEVTNALYADCVNAGACRPPTETSSDTRPSYYGNSEFDNFPVIYVDWNMAKTYCEWRGARLPTEAEWEKAARGTNGRTYPWGEELDKIYANYNIDIGDTTAVGSYEIGKSPYGVYDMAGNVWEWVADRYSDTYYQDSPLSNPLGPDSGQERVVRSGSWYDPAYLIRTSVRNRFNSTFVDNNFGIRCSRSVP